MNGHPQQARKSRFEIETLEPRIAPATVFINPGAVSGLIGPSDIQFSVPDQATVGLNTVEVVGPSDLVAVKG